MEHIADPAVTEPVANPAVTEPVAAPPVTEPIAFPTFRERGVVHLSRENNLASLSWARLLELDPTFERLKKFRGAVDPCTSICLDDQVNIIKVLAAYSELSPTELGARWNARINEWKKTFPSGVYADPDKAPDFNSWFYEEQRRKRMS